MDYASFTYKVTGDQTLEYPYYQSLTGPYFKGKDVESMEWTGCPVFQDLTNLCVESKKPWTCSCVTGEDDDLTFGFNMTVTKNMSGQPVWVEWRGPPVKKGREYVLPEIRAACPTIKTVEVKTSGDKSLGYLVADQDTVTFKFELSGNNSFHTLTGDTAPIIKYTTIKGDTETACVVFDAATGACVSKSGNDVCSCEKQKSGKYLITYIKTAKLDVSERALYMEWPGKPMVQTEKVTFPLIQVAGAPPPDAEEKAEEVQSAGMSTTLKILIGVGIAALIIAVGGAVAYFTMFSGTGNQVEAA
ncbi:hypothetical protein EGW08_017042 [Elysia chlorotica]|uniref:Uncharacterized protein n=1 Tax=Elysia chlorotica TaxID=188477 RepID=A0A3S0ZBP5_ELYCH|nr:hypothetical protein EGW08_017042 [Elysia chlorotica]